MKTTTTILSILLLVLSACEKPFNNEHLIWRSNEPSLCEEVDRSCMLGDKASFFVNGDSLETSSDATIAVRRHDCALDIELSSLYETEPVLYVHIPYGVTGPNSFDVLPTTIEDHKLTQGAYYVDRTHPQDPDTFFVTTTLQDAVVLTGTGTHYQIVHNGK